MKYWRPGLRVWWRSETEAQLGLDPPTILFGLTRADHDLLDALAAADPQLDCWSVAQRLGWTRAKFAAFLRRLPAHALVDAPSPQVSAVSRYWSLAEAAGAPHSIRRHSARAALDGADPLGLQIAEGLLGAGVHTLFIHDQRTVSAQDVHPGAYVTEEIGHPRTRAALARLRPRYPMSFISPGRPPRREQRSPVAPHQEDLPQVYAPLLRGAHGEVPPKDAGVDVAIVVASGAVEPWRVRPHAEAGTPVVPVTVRDLDVVVGPLLAHPGLCVRCVHLALTDADPRWPAVATQVAAQATPNLDPVVTSLAAATAAHQAVALMDGRPTAITGMSVHVDGVHPIPRFQRWDAHPRCGCHLEHLAG